LADLEGLFGTQLLCGKEHRFRHYNTEDINVARDDLIVGFMGEYQRRRDETEKPHEAALIVCGRRDKYQLSREVQDMLHRLQGAPVMAVEMSTVSSK
jgi:hypothetical protein